MQHACLFDVRAGGVGASAAAWGSKWVQLLDWEESGGRARRSEVWALTGTHACVCGRVDVCADN